MWPVTSFNRTYHVMTESSVGFVFWGRRRNKMRPARVPSRHLSTSTRTPLRTSNPRHSTMKEQGILDHSWRCVDLNVLLILFGVSTFQRLERHVQQLAVIRKPSRSCSIATLVIGMLRWPWMKLPLMSALTPLTPIMSVNTAPRRRTNFDHWHPILITSRLSLYIIHGFMTCLEKLRDKVVHVEVHSFSVPDFFFFTSML